MNIMITTWRSCAETSAASFRDTLVRTLVEMRDLCTRVAAQESKL